MGQRYIHPSENAKKQLKEGRALFKKVQQDRLKTVMEYIDLSIVPRFYFSKEKLGTSFDLLSYAVTNELLTKYVDTERNINNLKKIEGMLTLYYAQKLIRFLLTDISSIQDGVIPTTEDEIALRKSMEPYEKEIVITARSLAIPIDYDYFVKYILALIERHKDNIKKYFDCMSDKNKKVAIAINLKLSKLHKAIKNGDYDLSPLFDTSTNKKSDVGIKA